MGGDGFVVVPALFHIKTMGKLLLLCNGSSYPSRWRGS